MKRNFLIFLFSLFLPSIYAQEEIRSGKIVYVPEFYVQGEIGEGAPYAVFGLKTGSSTYVLTNDSVPLFGNGNFEAVEQTCSIGDSMEISGRMHTLIDDNTVTFSAFEIENVKILSSFSPESISSTYTGTLVSIHNPATEIPSMPGLVMGLECGDNQYILSKNGWFWDGYVEVGGIRYEEGDSVEIEGVVSTHIDLLNRMYFELEIDTIRNQDSPWFMEGSQWYYGIMDDGMGSGMGCIHMSVSGDTVLAEKKCQRLKIESCDGSYETIYEYVYSVGERLFYYNVAAKDFFMLLDLSAQPGDIIWVHTESFVPNPGFDPYQRWKLYRDSSFSFMAYQITAVDTVNLGGKTLKRQLAQPVNRNTDHGTELAKWMFPGWHRGYIIEEIGSLAGFFGEVWGLYPEWGKCELRCFSAEGKTFLSDGNCGETANEANKKTLNLRIYPNPANETITLSAAGCKLQRVEILDVNGRILYASALNDTDSFRYNVSWMPSGIYLARVTTPCGVLTEKFSVR